MMLIKCSNAPSTMATLDSYVKSAMGTIIVYKLCNLRRVRKCFKTRVIVEIL